MPSIVLMKSPTAGGREQSFPLPGAAKPVVIGRDDVCDVKLANTSVSRQHAKITYSNGRYYLQDLNSRNHTYVNNVEVTTPHPLKNDDRIKICDFMLRYHEDGTPNIPDYMRPTPADAPEPDGGGQVEHSFALRSGTELLESQPSERIRALLDISVGLSKTLDLDVLLNDIADILFGVFKQADRCFIVLADGKRLIPQVVRARRSVPGDDHRFSKTIVRNAMESLQSFLTEDASGDQALGAAQSISEFRIRSVMSVPLLSDERTAIGAIVLDTQDRGKKFRRDDLELLAAAANLCGVAIAKAKLHVALVAREAEQKEMELARKVQIGFLPTALPQLAGYEFFAFYSAAKTIGGDYYGFIDLPDGRLAVVLGDVAGKGVPAALLMAKLSAEVKACFRSQPDVAVAVNLLNDELIKGGIGDRFVTLAAAVLNPATHKVTLVNAGHMVPVVHRGSDGTTTDVVDPRFGGLPLGAVPGFEYDVVEVECRPGETLVLFTDGVTDAMNAAGTTFDAAGVSAALSGGNSVADAFPIAPRPVGERLVQAVKRHAAGHPQNDDIAVVCFGRPAPAPAAGPPTGPGRD